MADTKIRARKATSMLREDHRNVKKLFSSWEKIDDEDKETGKKELFDQIRRELSVHAQIEEEIFYPAMKGVDDEDLRSFVMESYEEHKIVHTLLEELSGLAPDDEVFEAKMEVLIEAVKHHAEEEEKELFPAFEELPRERQEDISDQLHRRKMELLGEVE